MSASKELAYSPAGEKFKVEVIQREDSPPVVICPGVGTSCPWRGRYKGAETCTVQIPSVDSGEFGVNLCGKSVQEDGDSFPD